MNNLETLAVALFVESFFVACIALFVYFKNSHSRVNLIFCCYSFTGFIFLFGTAMMLLAKDDSSIIFWDKTVYLGVIFMPPLMYHLGTLIAKKENVYKKWIILCYILSLILLPISRTDYFLSGLFRYKWGVHAIAQPLHHVFIIIFLIYIIAYLYIIYMHFRRSTAAQERNQAKYYLIASVVLMLTSIQFAPAYKIGVYPVGYFFIIAYLAIVGYAIVKYRLMDIKVAITRTGIFIAVYTLVLGFPFALAMWLKGWLIEMSGANWWMLPLGLMAALATVGPFIYIYLQGKAEERLHREQRRYQDILKQASLGMTRIRDLRKLLSLITHIVTKTVKIAYIAIYLYNRETDEYILVVSRDKGRLGIPKLTSDNPLVNWIVFKREPLIYEEIKRLMLDSHDATYKHLEKNMRLLTASVIIPSFLEDRFMGFIVLGEKISGQMYTPEDLNVFQVLASQSALAIENAQFYDETKKMQEQIAHAEKMATIGTMADGLSHQINNRFYALSLIAGDTIDTIKMTNTSKCTPEVKEMIGQINHALERVKVNVMQGAEVVKGMLKYSRPQDKAFETLTLDQIIDGTLDMVQYKVRLSELDIVRDYPKDTPKIKGNLAQLIEVFFNFIDNAYDSIVERRELLKEEGYRGRIVISTHPKIEEGVLEIVVEDNGIGIKEQDSKKIFTPFFTTKTSSRKGTGLGLYVIRRIIAELHKGKIAFESQYKVGTRFIVELAVAK
jgi:signal transduction histidine kinase